MGYELSQLSQLGFPQFSHLKVEDTIVACLAVVPVGKVEKMVKT